MGYFPFVETDIVRSVIGQPHLPDRISEQLKLVCSNPAQHRLETLQAMDVRMFIVFVAGLLCMAQAANLWRPVWDKGLGQLERPGLFEMVAKHPGVVDRAVDQMLELHGLTRDQVDPDLLPESRSPGSYISCAECNSVFTAVRLGLTLGMDFDGMRPLAITACGPIMGPVAAPVVCEGAIDVFGPHVVDIMNFTRPEPVSDICELLYSCDRPLPDDDGTTVYIRRPQVPQPRSKRDPTEGTLRVAHLSDIHVDEQYFTGSAVDCGLPVCCRDYWNGTGSARRWGEYACNAPPSTVDLILQKVAELEPDIITYTGDSAPHSVWEETLEIQIEANRFVALAIDRNIPGIPAYSCIGNHETYPTNLYYTPRPEIQILNEEFGSMWEELSNFGQEQIDSIMKAAYYSVLARPGLRVISYNSNYGESENWYNALNRFNSDFTEMVDFLWTAFQEAEDNGEKVILLGHHPSVGTIWEFGWAIHDLSVRYGDIIALHLLGHVHSDRLHVVVDDETGEARSVQNVGIAVDPGPNPGFKMFYLDPETFEVVDYDHYNLNLETADGDNPEMELHYRATVEYGLNDLSPVSWLDLTFRFEEDDDLFQQYQRNKRGRRENFSPCTGGCKDNELCSLRNTSADRNRRCREGL